MMQELLRTKWIFKGKKSEKIKKMTIKKFLVKSTIILTPTNLEF